MTPEEKAIVLEMSKDLVREFLSGNRREIPKGAIEEAISGGWITTDEIFAAFVNELDDSVTRWLNEQNS